MDALRQYKNIVIGAALLFCLRASEQRSTCLPIDDISASRPSNSRRI